MYIQLLETNIDTDKTEIDKFIDNTFRVLRIPFQENQSPSECSSTESLFTVSQLSPGFTLEALPNGTYTFL